MSYITEQNQPPGWYPESTGETSGDVTVRPLSVVENGTYVAPSGTAYSPVDVNVEAGVSAEALSVVANGTYNAPSGKAYTPVSVNVPVGATTRPLTATENGTYTAPSGEAYTPVIVNVPTGSSLPSVISKVDGGSFTHVGDTSCGGYEISHNLGVSPKGFAIWTEDEIGGIVETRHMGNCALVTMNLVNKNSVTNVSGGIVNLLYNGNISGINVEMNSTATSGYMSSARIRWNNNLVYYKAGATYKWLAWA